MATPQENLMHWLRDAYAMGKQAIESVENQVSRLQNYPELRAWAGDHVEAAKRHREMIRECIERNGGSTSTIKDIAMTVMGNVQQVTGALTQDEVLKNVITDYGFKHYQIASYKSLTAAAEEANDVQTAQVCQNIAQAEQALADRLAPYIPQVTKEYLRRDAAKPLR